MTQASIVSRLFRVKSVDQMLAEAGHGDGGDLKRSMGLLSLTMFSVGAIVGTGIFVILGNAVPRAGPAVVVSFLLAATACVFSALSYAELTGSIPVSGSSYSYAYATLGEIVAWVCGWCLMLEYGVSVAAVAVGWGQYVNELLVHIPGLSEIPDPFLQPTLTGGVFNVPAVVVVVLAGMLLLRGASESATVNTIMVFTKIGILMFFCVIAFTAFNTGNMFPFFPLGAAGVSAAAAHVFFSYIGFDAASTAGEEAKNPRRDLPRAIIFSLIIVTVLYVLVALAAVGAKPWQQFAGQGGDAVLATILQQVTGKSWPAVVVSIGAIISIFSVVLTVMYGQTRILFAMGRDGLLPKAFTRVNPRTQTPVFNTLIVTGVIVLLAGVIPLGALADATSIGTLFAFAIVNVGVIVLRQKHPNLERSFRTPWYPFTPIMGVLMCGFLLANLGVKTWAVFGVWMILGFVLYFSYGFRKSKLHQAHLRGEQATATSVGSE